MNLRVDLILETERRSASVLSLKGFVRIVLIVIPLVILLLIGNEIMDLMTLRNEVNAQETEWRMAGPKEKKAGELAVQYQLNLAMRKELDGWRNSRLDWHQQLSAIMTETPTNVQFQSLSVGHAFQLIEDKTPARVFSMELRGRASGADAEAGVRQIEHRLTQGPAFSNLTRKVEVPQYGADAAKGADKNDRIFVITCGYRERKLE